MNILIGVENRVATPPSNSVIVCGNSDYTLTFDFDSEWAAETVKIARFVWFSRNKAHSEEITFEGNTVVAPVLSNTNAVYVGVYAGNLRTTTPAKIVCEPSILCYGQDANTNPSDIVLIKGQIAELVKALKDISVDPAEIKNAVTEYLAKNPVKESDPTVPAWAKEKNKPTYTAKEVGAVASSELSSAVNDALAQAKASGEFDGRDGMDGKPGANGKDGAKGDPGEDGKSAYEYAQDAGYTGSESAFAAKLAEEHALACFTSQTTPAQVVAAIDAGKNVILIHTDDTFGMLVFTGFLYVQSVNAGVSSGIWDFEGTPMRFSLLGDVGTGKWSFTYDMLADIDDIPEIPGALPNPNALTFTGAVSGTYDGSSAVTIDIPVSGGNVDFKTDETLTLKDGILSVNTTDLMEQDNTLPITSAGVYATVGNIEALLKTI